MISSSDTSEFDVERPRCKTCLDDWYILDGKCFYGCLSVKKVWDQTEKIYDPICCTCMDKYRMKTVATGECEKCTPTNCDLCAAKKDTCTQCEPGYYLINNKECKQ